MEMKLHNGKISGIFFGLTTNTVCRRCLQNSHFEHKKFLKNSNQKCIIKK